MELEEQQTKKSSRTEMNLENYLRMVFHPKGFYGFMDGVNKELELGSIQSSVNKVIGTSADITKYLVYAGITGIIIYEFLK